MNREQRRHPEQSDPSQSHQNPASSPGEDQLRPERPQDEASVRAKNSGHKKKTADKWNQ